MKVLFATAELAPVARVGGLAEAAGGLVIALRNQGVTVDVVLPDYDEAPLQSETRSVLAVPAWAAPMWVRRGFHPTGGELLLVGSDAIRRPHPYLDVDGEGWPDNDLRFAQFSLGIAALRDELEPNLVHLNDWHTAASLGFGTGGIATALTIHTLAYQGEAPDTWLSRLTTHASAFKWGEAMNPLAGAIRLADRVIAVSPTYASEVLHEAAGMGLHDLLRSKGDAFVGILNGIDTDDWDPATDPHIEVPYSQIKIEGRERCRAALVHAAGWEDTAQPIIGVVTRLVDQKGIDLLVESIPELGSFGARLIVLGSGSPELAGALQQAAAQHPLRVYFREGYDLAFAHKVFAGADLYAMPSRFEPCGLAQMQAMRYGAIPVVMPVGGLLDTVVDADASASGTGFIAGSIDTAGLVEALARGIRVIGQPERRAQIQRRGMGHDWSWTLPARRHVAMYEDMTGLEVEETSLT